MPSVAAAVETGELIGAFDDGQFSWATRSEYAAAAVAVLIADGFDCSRMYELAG